MRLSPRGEILMTGYGADLQDIVQALLRPAWSTKPRPAACACNSSNKRKSLSLVSSSGRRLSPLAASRSAIRPSRLVTKSP